MKIRTDFVTNSSSYSSVCITIESKELAQLLKKYEIQLGVPELSVRGSKTSVFNDEFALEWGNVPTSVNQVLDALMTSLRAYHCAQYDAFREEASTRKKELTDSLQSVRWEFEDDSDGTLKCPTKTGRSASPGAGQLWKSSRAFRTSSLLSKTSRSRGISSC